MPHSWDDENQESSFSTERGAITALRIFAWLDLVCGIILAIIIWAKFSSTKITTGTYYSATETITNPVAIGLGLAVFLQGIFICAFFLVVASMADNLIVIRENTEPKSK